MARNLGIKVDVLLGILPQLIEVSNEMLSVPLVCFEALYEESSLKKGVAYSFSVFLVYRPSDG